MPHGVQPLNGDVAVFQPRHEPFKGIFAVASHIVFKAAAEKWLVPHVPAEECGMISELFRQLFGELASYPYPLRVVQAGTGVAAGLTAGIGLGIDLSAVGGNHHALRVLFIEP